MPTPNLVVFYVQDVAASVAFYADLLGRAPREQQAGFAMFGLDGGMALGLWARDAVRPSSRGGAAAAELVWLSDDVDAVHEDWSRRGLAVAQLPTDMEFGRNFVALDPDGYRLRVLASAPVSVVA